MQIEFVPDKGAAREAVCAHVRDVYFKTFGAHVRQFPPLFAVARGPDGRITSVAGIRTSADGFFSDCYLDMPFEQMLDSHSQRFVDPGRILEVVSMASTSPFSVLPILDAIIGWGRDRGKDWAVFTATAPLRHLLRRAGMDHAMLAPAKADRVTNPGDWGSYYVHDPWVCAFDDGGTAQKIVLDPRRRAS